MEWATSYPDLVGRVIPVSPGGLEANPYLTAVADEWAMPIYDDPKWNGGDYYGKDEPLRGMAEAQPLVLLDEPSEGVQWENILHMAALIDAAKAQGVAFVVVEQNLAFAELIANRYLVIEQGRVVLEGRHGEIGRERLLSHLHV